MDTRKSIVDTFRLIAEQLRRHDIMHMDAITFLPVIEEGIRMMDIVRTDKQKERKYLVGSDGKITPLPDVVRCKDCKYGEKTNDVYLCGKSRSFGIAHDQSWFCADGERRTDDA